MNKLKAPFPWFGGKRRVAALVWQWFGDTVNYVEPFAGSLAVLLERPGTPRNETVNDKDCFIANFWRALQSDPEGVAEYARWPVNEADLHARHQWLHQQKEFIEKMHSDPDHYNVKVAGWWVWGISCWIGDNWCRVTKQSGLPKLKGGAGVQRDLNEFKPHRQRPCLTSRGIPAKRPLIKKGGTGVNRQLPHISGDSGASGKGVHSKRASNLTYYFIALHERLKKVRVCCGEWYRILGPSPTVKIGMTAVFLDPPYGDPRRDTVYNQDSFEIAADVRKWCTEHTEEKKLRIALCGFEGEHNELEGSGWTKIEWLPGGGYGSRNKNNDNRKLERIWFSPSCLDPEDRFF